MVCTDPSSILLLTLLFSHSLLSVNPAANPAHTDIQAVIGETVVIEFYASSLPLTQAGNYTWWHNDVPITSGNFQNQKRRLEISNAQESHSGEYRFRVLLRFSASLQLSALTSTHLVVAGMLSIYGTHITISDIHTSLAKYQIFTPDNTSVYCTCSTVLASSAANSTGVLPSQGRAVC